MNNQIAENDKLEQFLQVVGTSEQIKENLQVEQVRSQQLNQKNEQIQTEIDKLYYFLLNYKPGKIIDESDLLDLGNNFVTKHSQLMEKINQLQYNIIPDQLKKTVSSLQKLEEQKEASLFKQYQCINCKQKYLNSLNDDVINDIVNLFFKQSCQFHWGMIKFFSCRSCGADEYYACCLKCEKCSIGCRIQKHYFA